MTAVTALPNSWNVFNLQSSPFWQDPLGDEDVVHPLHLFVGREVELSLLTDGLYAAGASSSRRAIAGAPGVGKTTLVKRFKAVALSAGYLTGDAVVPILSDDTPESLFGRVLGSVYDIVLATRPGTLDHPAMRAAQVLVRASREVVRGGGLSLAGFGASASQAVSTTSPREIMLDGARVMRDLLALVQSSDARGVIMHLNNLENLGDADIRHAATLLRDLRDPMMMHPGLHVVLVGTVTAIRGAVLTHPQVRSVFSVLDLPPLSASEVLEVLRRRYGHLCRDVNRPWVAPVADDAVEALHTLFRGDLRGLLKALDDGVRPTIGLLERIRPLTRDELTQNLRAVYARELSLALDALRVRQLTAWGTTDALREHTQRSLRQLWAVSQPAVSVALTQLIAGGFVVELPKDAGGPNRYALSGVSRVAFGG